MASKPIHDLTYLSILPFIFHFKRPSFFSKTELNIKLLSNPIAFPSLASNIELREFVFSFTLHNFLY